MIIAYLKNSKYIRTVWLETGLLRFKFGLRPNFGQTLVYAVSLVLDFGPRPNFSVTSRFALIRS